MDKCILGHNQCAEHPTWDELPGLDAPPRMGRCVGGRGHYASAIWTIPKDNKAYCALHLLEVMRRVTWPHPIRRRTDE